MPFDCQHRARHGPDGCLTDCPANTPVGGLDFARVERPGDLPPADARVVDVALLDMHHGWPNLGHDSLVHALQSAVCDMQAGLESAGLSVRVVSYDVRRGHMIPEPPGGRHVIYIGTGGPGHLDPACNDGNADGSQGIVENPAWEPRLFRVFDRILADDHASLFGVCHTFGVMCRWLGVADAVLRGASKGGKSAGITENVLTDAALHHPWYRRFSEQLPDRRHFRVLDNRLYDLVPRGPLPPGVTAVAHEALGHDGPAGEAVTMIEAARDRDGVMPRVAGVNHHPEIVNRQRLITVLRRKLERGNVTREWYEERMRTLSEPIEDEHGDRLLHLTASYTLMAPLRFSLYRAVQERADSLGRRLAFDAEDLPLTYSLAADTLSAHPA
jgi:hypothetical protein